MTTLHSRPRTLLINAPFGLIEFPHLGTSLIKAAVREAGFECDVLYATLEFARVIGFTEYLSIERAACPMLLPERPFAQILCENIPPLDSFYTDLVAPFSERLFPFIHSESQNMIGRDSMKRVEDCARSYTEAMTRRPELAAYDVIAFSSSYGQHVASLAIAKGLKERFPNVIIAFGGANCEGAMGKQLVRSFPFVDYAFSGDGDVSFPLFLAALRDGRRISLPGVYHRATLAPDDSDLGPPLTRINLDELPYPDYSDYFAALARAPEGRNSCAGIPIEGSRGCWWGEKHHCTFCGLNGMTMRYRVKTPQRFKTELKYLVERYACRDVMAADNILDRKYFKTLLPALGEERVHRVLFFEVKANLEKGEVRALADAGVTQIQPGIESLSTSILKLLDKGTTSLQNLQLLKWAEEYGVTLIWNVLCGIPGEMPEAYDEMAVLMQKIPHLQPPAAFARITVDRFSPYFKFPEKYGIEIHPSTAYRYVYALPAEDIANMAYWYYYSCGNGSSRGSLEPPEYARNAVRIRAIWQRAYGKVWFRYTIEEDGRVRLEDTRPLARKSQVLLNPIESQIFVMADRAVTRRTLHRNFSDNGSGLDCRPEQVDQILADLEARQILHRENDRYLALATTAKARAKIPGVGEGSGPTL